jgi:hypothetical protein
MSSLLAEPLKGNQSSVGGLPVQEKPICYHPPDRKGPGPPDDPSLQFKRALEEEGKLKISWIFCAVVHGRAHNLFQERIQRYGKINTVVTESICTVDHGIFCCVKRP